MSSMCCAVLYIYLYIFCCSWQRLLDFCCLPAKFELFFGRFFSVAFLFSLRFFALLAFFSGKSLNAPSPAEARHLCDPVDNMDQNTKSRSGRTAAAGNMRQDEAGWGSCQILVLVSGCGATCCPGCVHECVWGVCVCCDQHCWSTHSHTHTPVQTLPGCVVIFFLSVSPAAACHCPHLL